MNRPEQMFGVSGLTMCLVIAMTIIDVCSAQESGTNSHTPPVRPTEHAARGGTGKTCLHVITNSIGMKLKRIPTGEFMMGSSRSPAEIVQRFKLGEDDARHFADEHPRHCVQISKTFYLGVHEVTVGQFRQFVEATDHKTDAEKSGEGSEGWNESKGELEGYDPAYTWRNVGFPQTDAHPVVSVSWNDGTAFCEWLSRKEGDSYRLPTEAEWEHACRAGTTTLYCSGDDPEALAQVDNVADASAPKKPSNVQGMWRIRADDGHKFTAPVGRFPSNGFGLHDMHGNVIEWCADWHGRDYEDNSPADNVTRRELGPGRVVRGGGWYAAPWGCRSATRNGVPPILRTSWLGFRVALDKRTEEAASARRTPAHERKEHALDTDR